MITDDPSHFKFLEFKILKLIDKRSSTSRNNELKLKKVRIVNADAHATKYILIHSCWECKLVVSNN